MVSKAPCPQRLGSSLVCHSWSAVTKEPAGLSSVQDGWEATERSYTRPVAERQVVLGRLAYNLRNEISMCNVELIVASVCCCNSTGFTPIFTTSVSSKERKTVSNTDFTIFHIAILVMAVLVCGRSGLSVWQFWTFNVAVLVWLVAVLVMVVLDVIPLYSQDCF